MSRKVLLKAETGKEYQLEVPEGTTVAQMKDIFVGRLTLQVEDVRMSVAGQPLGDDQKVSDLRPDAVVDVEYRVVSGEEQLSWQIPPAGVVDPPNFQELVDGLVELGFERRQCEQALRMSQFDTNRAAETLLTGEFTANHTEQPQGRFGPLQSYYDSLAPEEKAAVDRLCQIDIPPLTVIQVYVACDKDEEQARKLLE